MPSLEKMQAETMVGSPPKHSVKQKLRFKKSPPRDSNSDNMIP